MDNKDYADKRGGWVENNPPAYPDFDLGENECME